ncbi:MAG: helix-turn-helix domain-containing protein [Rhizobiales bacterium]|nr:helix-turn-helix domain-containing protein [Hyphomicrobiales bacterium]
MKPRRKSQERKTAPRAAVPPSLTVTVDEACRLIGIGRSLFYEAVRNGDLQVRKYGARTLVLRSEIDRFVANLPAVGRPAV